MKIKNIKRIIRKIIYPRNIYYDDTPIKKYKYDYIGVEEQCKFLEENINESPGLIGIISDHGSGKSSIINMLVYGNCINYLLKKFLYKYKIVNLLEDSTNNSITKEDIIKKILLSIVSKNNYYYYNALLNPNYKIISVKTKNKFEKICAIIFGILFLFGIFNKSIPSFESIIYYFPFWLKIILINLRQFSGIVGLLGLIIISIFTKVAYKLPSKNDENKITLDDINEYLRKEIKKYDFIVIEELDRINNSNNIVKDILNILYNISKDTETTFIISILPKQFEELDNENAEAKIKPFKVVLKIEQAIRENYNEILLELLKEKSNQWNNIGIKIPKSELFIINNKLDENKCLDWMWVSKGDKINIRVMKHRLNDIISLYMKLKSRFPKRHINIYNCIFIIFLKSEYPSFYNYLLEETDFMINDKKIDVIWLKYLIASENTNEADTEFITKFSNQKSDFEEKIKEMLIDIHNFDKTRLDYKYLDIYCFNYPKTSIIYSDEENYIYNCFKDNKEIEVFIDEKVDEIIANSDCIKDAYNYRMAYKSGKLPNNLSHSYPIVKYVYDELLDSDDKSKKIANEMYMINKDTVEDVLANIKWLKTNDLELYRKIIVENFYELYKKLYNSGFNADDIHQYRKELLNHLDNNNIDIELLFPENTLTIEYVELESANLNTIDGIEMIPSIKLSKMNETDLATLINNKIISDSKLEEILSHLNIDKVLDIIYNITYINPKLIDYLEKNVNSLGLEKSLKVISIIGHDELIENRILSFISQDNKKEIIKRLLEFTNISELNILKEYICDYSNINYISNEKVYSLKEKNEELFDILIQNKLKDIKENNTNDELLKYIFDNKDNKYLDNDLKQIIIDKELYKDNLGNMMILSKQYQTIELLNYILDNHEIIDIDKYINNSNYDSYYNIKLNDLIVERLWNTLGDKLEEYKYKFYGYSMTRITNYLKKQKHINKK